jgi:glycosyltransferase involved in cell wall biosynthesis
MRQVQGLISGGAQATLLCPEIMVQGGEEKLHDPFFRGVTVRAELPNHSNPVVRELGTLFRSPRIIRSVMEDLRPDIVHVHNPPDTMPFVTSLACKALDLPMIYDIHDAALETISAVEFSRFRKYIYLKISLFFEKRAALGSSGILFVSRTAKESFIGTRAYMKNYPDRAIAVMKNTDPAYSEIRSGPDQEIENYVLYSGTLYSNFLGLEDFIDAFTEIAGDSPMKFLIVGDGPYKSRLEQFVKLRGVGDKVFFLGFLDRWDLRERISRARMCVIPYRDTPITSITLPHKLFEYMAYGKAIIHPRFPGFAEVLGQDDPAGYRSGDREDMKRVIRILLADNTLREAVGRRNKELLDKISFDRELQHMVDLYQHVMDADVR